jgi:hypothetical protein
VTVEVAILLLPSTIIAAAQVNKLRTVMELERVKVVQDHGLPFKILAAVRLHVVVQILL